MSAVMVSQPEARYSQGIPCQHDMYPPINFVYKHLHDSIRSELASVNKLVLILEEDVNGETVLAQLKVLQARYQMLEQINRYHSSVEDEVVYPALEFKVHNVTQAYSVEHDEEELLFDHLQSLLARGISAPESEREATIHEFVCKVEEVHVSLQKHLSKEEEQLFPLLLQHFTYEEQADLVIQFVCCIPVSAVKGILSWLKRSCPPDEQAALCHYVTAVLAAPELCRLLNFWLQPELPSNSGSDSVSLWPSTAAVPHIHPDITLSSASSSGQLDRAPPFSLAVSSACNNYIPMDMSEASPGARTSTSSITMARDNSRDKGVSILPLDIAVPHPCGTSLISHPAYDPLDSLVYLHRGILLMLRSLMAEVREVHDNGHVLLIHVDSLVERHRFLCAISSFHRLSEQDFVYPVARQLGHGELACLHCEEAHRDESGLLTLMGRLLADLESCVRRSSKETASLLTKLLQVSNSVCAAMEAHIQREEKELLPELRKSLNQDQKHSLVWSTLQAMPLRLLERVMPWLAHHIGPVGFSDMMHRLQLAVPRVDDALLSLLRLWALRALPLNTKNIPSPLTHPTSLKNVSSSPNRSPVPTSLSSPGTVFDLHMAFPVSTCVPSIVQLASCQHRRSSCDDAPSKRRRVGVGPPAFVTCGAGDADSCHADAADSFQGARGQAVDSSLSDMAKGSLMPTGNNPIDHIFQFHKALRRELHQLEKEAKYLQLICDYPDKANMSFETLLQRLEGRFHFLGGIYQAHSHAEDEVVFPALEAKQALRNISHFYILDHQQEHKQFADLLKVISSLQEQVRTSCSGHSIEKEQQSQRRGLVSKLRQKCAAIRCNLETHVRAEEAELWPLFAEHFTTAEQSQLVGTIIGRTGAEVLQALIPWVMGSFSEDETGAMIGSLREASKNTRFDKWMDTMLPTLVDLDLADDQSILDIPSNEELPSTSTISLLHSPSQPNAVDPADGLSPSATPMDITSDAPHLTTDSHCLNTTACGPTIIDSATVADMSEYRPGWEDIFRMNTAQLEAAFVQVSDIPSVEQKRRAYVTHNLMVSRFVVAQQQRMRMNAHVPDTTTACSTPPSTSSHIPNSPHAPLSGTHVAHSAQSDTSLVSPTDLPAEHHCPHYHCNCKLIAPCCGSAVTCRLCHDEAEVCSQSFDRYAVKEMVCQLCMTQQPVSQHCSNCSASMARYYCSACHLFDDMPGRAIYHCPFCNVCRRGQGLGIDFFHCMQCNACMSLTLFNKHKCRERCMESNCPLCHENLFSSSQPVKELPCGHFMHSSCFAEYTQHFYTCPICCRSVGDLTLYFRMLDSLLLSETLPPELAAQTQKVHCNDCSANKVVPFHFVYHKCPSCSSYNTRLL